MSLNLDQINQYKICVFYFFLFQYIFLLIIFFLFLNDKYNIHKNKNIRESPESQQGIKSTHSTKNFNL
jgi:hypothetical protein